MMGKFPGYYRAIPASRNISTSPDNTYNRKHLQDKDFSACSDNIPELEAFRIQEHFEVRKGSVDALGGFQRSEENWK